MLEQQKLNLTQCCVISWPVVALLHFAALSYTYTLPKTWLRGRHSRLLITLPEHMPFPAARMLCLLPGYRASRGGRSAALQM